MPWALGLGAGSALSRLHSGSLCLLGPPRSGPSIKAVQGPRTAGSHTDTPSGQLSFHPSTCTWCPCPWTPCQPCHSSLMMVSRPPNWLQELSEHLALTQGPLGRPRGAQASVIRVQEGEERAEMRVECHGVSMLPGPAPVPCPLPVPNPPAPEPLPSTVLGPPGPAHPLCRSQKPEA